MQIRIISVDGRLDELGCRRGRRAVVGSDDETELFHVDGHFVDVVSALERYDWLVPGARRWRVLAASTDGNTTRFATHGPARLAHSLRVVADSRPVALFADQGWEIVAQQVG